MGMRCRSWLRASRGVDTDNTGLQVLVIQAQSTGAWGYRARRWRGGGPYGARLDQGNLDETVALAVMIGLALCQLQGYRRNCCASGRGGMYACISRQLNTGSGYGVHTQSCPILGVGVGDL